MAKSSSQKYTQRNRPARVEIEYEVHTGGASQKVSLPFVMGVMADLSAMQETGDAVQAQHRSARGSISERQFLEFDAENFNDRMKAMKPRVAVRVPNTLTGEGEMSVDLTFESMDDFSPDRIAAKVDALKSLLDTRTQLQNLLTYMDGKEKAEGLIAQALQDPALLQALASSPNPDAEASGDQEKSNG